MRNLKKCKKPLLRSQFPVSKLNGCVYSSMADLGKRTSLGPRTSLGTLSEQGEIDDLIRTGGTSSHRLFQTETFPGRQFDTAVHGKLAMQTSSNLDRHEEERNVSSGRSFPLQLSRRFFQSRSPSFSSSIDGSLSPTKSRHGTESIEDPITHQEVVRSRVLLLYTGGALGWKVDPEGNK